MADWLDIYSPEAEIDLHIRFAPENRQTIEDSFSSIKLTQLTFKRASITMMVPDDKSLTKLSLFLLDNRLTDISFARLYK